MEDKQDLDYQLNRLKKDTDLQEESIKLLEADNNSKAEEIEALLIKRQEM